MSTAEQTKSFINILIEQEKLTMAVSTAIKREDLVSKEQLIKLVILCKEEDWISIYGNEKRLDKFSKNDLIKIVKEAFLTGNWGILNYPKKAINLEEESLAFYLDEQLLRV